MKIIAFAPVALALGTVLLSGCVSPPTGPNVTAMPGTGKSYEQFMADDSTCQNYARSGLNQALQQANNSAVNTAAAGTIIGAAGGALLGAASGHAGPGALIGAGSGLLVGSAMGNDSSMESNDDIQQRYNSVYIQCMYAKGDKVPMPAGYEVSSSDAGAPPDYNPGDSGAPPDYPQQDAGAPPDY
jgi:uncharacterized protein YcfJ